MLALILRVDAAVQSAVDETAFSIMRRFGIRKLLLREILYWFSIACLLTLAIVINGYPFSMWYRAVFTALMGVGAFGLLLGLHIIRLGDQYAESAGMRTSLSEKAAWMNACNKVIWAFVVAWLTFSAVRDEGVVQVNVTLIIVGLCMITELYLAKTPNSPPPKREKRSLELAPVPSRS